MVSGTLKIRQNHWRVVQNQGSLENVKMSSEVASRVNFGAILRKCCWLPKYCFCKKRGSWKSVQKKYRKSWNDIGKSLWTNRMAPGKASPRVKELLSNQTRNNCLSNCCSIVVDLLQKKVSRCNKKWNGCWKFRIGCKKGEPVAKSGSESMKLLKKWQQVVERKLTQCLWSDTP